MLHAFYWLIYALGCIVAYRVNKRGVAWYDKRIWKPGYIRFHHDGTACQPKEYILNPITNGQVICWILLVMPASWLIIFIWGFFRLTCWLHDIWDEPIKIKWL